MIFLHQGSRPRGVLKSQENLRESPDLVGVASRARPSLHDGTVVLATVGEIQAKSCHSEFNHERSERTDRRRCYTLVHERNAVIAGVVPGLSSEARVALPDLHLDAVSGCWCDCEHASQIRHRKWCILTRSSVEAVVSARNLNSGLAGGNHPVLSGSAVAVVAVGLA